MNNETKKEDENLKRMLKAPPKPHAPLKSDSKPAKASRAKKKAIRKF